MIPREGGDPPALSSGARRVQAAILAAGFGNQVFELERPVRTAADAASAVGCDVSQIAKSLIFMTRQSRRPILVITSGANRVNEKTVATLVGEPLARATPDFVREHTGYAIGGVPPLGFQRPLETFVDVDLIALHSIWAAAGHPNALFKLTPEELLAMANGRVVTVT